MEKNEVFLVLYGSVEITIGEKGTRKKHILEKGDYLEVPYGTTHGFFTENGVVFEEVSTCDEESDSHYEKSVVKNRKTLVREF